MIRLLRHDLWYHDAMTFEARHIGVSIDCSPEKVYVFSANPQNLPRWATGLSGSVTIEGTKVIAESPMGEIVIQFAKQNTFGVLDHDVTLADGQRFYNPMRVFRNGNGSEVTFTLYRLPGVTDEAFEKDAVTIEGDLKKLKAFLEK